MRGISVDIWALVDFEHLAREGKRICINANYANGFTHICKLFLIATQLVSYKFSFILNSYT